VRAALKGGPVQRPWFGASLQQITPDIADSLGLDRPAGALVKNVHHRGPAAKAGIQERDVIVSVDGQEVGDPQAFTYRFITKGIGGMAELGIVRNGRPLKATVTLIAPVEDPPRDERTLSGRHPLSGAKVANLSPAVADELGMEDGDKGVVILDVQAQTPAQQLGVQRGDIIVGVNNNNVGSVAGLVAALQGSQGAWQLSLERNGRLFNVTIQD
jgi:S1-C subfamily serine protease